MPELAYLNGEFGPIESAKVSINDRGFQFADSVYEVIVAYDGKPFRMQEHLDRLQRSLELSDMAIDVGELGLGSLISDGIERAGFGATVIYIQITRGVQERNHVYADNLTPTVLLTFREKHPVKADWYRDGVSVMSVKDERWALCEIKATGLLANVIAKNRAVRSGFQDALLLSSDGLVRECTASNVFAIGSGNLITPAADTSILHGITRNYVLECAESAGVVSEERSLTLDELYAADEVFVSSTMVDILPVTRVDERAIGEGGVGPVTKRLQEAFRAGMSRSATAI